jgi:hypothetical protein
LIAFRRPVLGALIVASVVGLAGAFYLKARYDVTAIVTSTVREWLIIHTDWYVASVAEVEEQIAAAREWTEANLTRRSARGPLRVSTLNPRYFAAPTPG